MATEFITEVVPPAQLTGWVREATADGRPFDAWLPPRSVNDIEYELTNADGRAGMQVAKYRSWDVAPPLGKRPGVSIIGGEIPPVGLSVKLNEKDVLRFNKVRASAAELSDFDVIDTMFNDALNMGQAVNNRITIGTADLLVDGSVTVEGSVSGAAVVATFAVPAAHLAVSPAALFNDYVNAIPVTNFAAWQAIFRSNNGGRNPDLWITSSTIVNDLTLNAQIRALSPSNADGSTRGIVNPTTVAQVLQAHGIAPIVAVDLELPQVASDTLARVLPERQLIGVIVENLGNVLFAPSPSAALLAGNGQLEFSDAAGVVAFSEQSIRPASIMTTGEAVALPVLRDPNALFSVAV